MDLIVFQYRFLAIIDMSFTWWEDWSAGLRGFFFSFFKNTFLFSKISEITNMASLKIVFVIESNVPSTDKSPKRTLWDTIGMILRELHYPYETVELDKLDFQEQESVNKFLNADIVIMVRRRKNRCHSMSFSFRMLPIKFIRVFICITKVHEKMSSVWMTSFSFKPMILKIILQFNIWK